jgi:hypothetical protein
MKKKVKILPINSNNTKTISSSKTVHSSIFNIIKISHNHEKFRSKTLVSKKGMSVIF